MCNVFLIRFGYLAAKLRLNAIFKAVAELTFSPSNGISI
jgi:hypothetical protein